MDGCFGAKKTEVAASSMSSGVEDSILVLSTPIAVHSKKLNLKFVIATLNTITKI